MQENTVYGTTVIRTVQNIGLQMSGLLLYLAAYASITYSNSHFMFFLSSSIPFPFLHPSASFLSTADCAPYVQYVCERGEWQRSLYRRKGIVHRIVGVLGCCCQDTNTHFMFFLPPSHPHSPPLPQHC